VIVKTEREPTYGRMEVFVMVHGKTSTYMEVGFKLSMTKEFMMEILKRGL